MLAPVRRATSADLAAVEQLQRAAYAANRLVLGVESLPLLADYTAILSDMEVWLHETDDGIVGVLILDVRPDDLLIWSVATMPGHQQRGLGRALLAWSFQRAADLGRHIIRLYTGTLLTDRIAWYQRHGFVIERIEKMPDRSATHMLKRLE